MLNGTWLPENRAPVHPDTHAVPAKETSRRFVFEMLVQVFRPQTHFRGQVPGNIEPVLTYA